MQYIDITYFCGIFQYRQKLERNKRWASFFFGTALTIICAGPIILNASLFGFLLSGFSYGLREEGYLLFCVIGMLFCLAFLVAELVDILRSAQFWKESRWKQILWICKHACVTAVFGLICWVLWGDALSPGYPLIPILSFTGAIVNLLRLGKEIAFLVPRVRTNAKAFWEKNKDVLVTLES